MSQLISATNSWGERQSWKSAAIHKTKKKEGEGQKENGSEGKEEEGCKHEAWDYLNGCLNLQQQ